MFNIKYFFCALLSSFLAFPPTVVVPATAHAQQVVFIVGNNYKIPKIYADESGSPSGILIDILKHIDQRMEEYSFRYHLYPWARAFRMAQDAEGGIIGLSMTSERTKIFDYSDPVYMDTVAVIVRRGEEFPFTGLSDLAGKRIGIGRMGTFGDKFDRMREENIFTVYEDNGPVLRLRMLLAGRIDCALISPMDIGLQATIGKDERLQELADEFVQLPVPVLQDPNYLGFAKAMNMKDFLEKFNAVLRQENRNGSITRIIEKSFPKR